MSLAFALAVRRAVGDAAAITIADPGRRGRDPRAFALSPAAVVMLDRLAVWEPLVGRAQPIAGMRITDGRIDDVVRQRYLAFEAEGPEPLGWMIEAEALHSELLSACRAAGLLFDTRTVSRFALDDAVSGMIEVWAEDGASRRVNLLVAADGARSRLRERAGIGWTGRRYPQAGIVATVSHERDHRGVAVQHFLSAGPFAILPLAGPGTVHPYRSSIVWSEDEHVARDVARMTPDEALDAVRTRMGPELGAIALETGLGSHPLAVGLARRFVGSRFALLGDAAHEVHPLAGQGLNLGLGDAAALAERVVDFVRLGLDPGSPDPLRNYERDRRVEAVTLAGVTDGLNRLFSNDLLPVRALRDLGLGIVDRTPGVKRFFAGQASGRTARAPRLMRDEAL